MSNTLPGQLLAVYVLATLLAAIGGAWLARRYRAALLPLMRAPLSAGSRTTTAAAPSASPSPTQTQTQTQTPARRPQPTLTLARHRGAQARLVLLLIGISMAIALTRGALWLWLSRDTGTPFSASRLVVLAVVYCWPLLPALGLMWRWSWSRLSLALVGWYAASMLLVMVNSTQAQSLVQVAGWLAFEIGVPTLALMLLTLRGTRAAAPWLWPPLALLLFAALLGLDLLSWLVAEQSPLLLPLVRHVEPLTAMALFALAAVALAGWPVSRFARALVAAYGDKRVSDLMVVFGAAWLLNLGFDALGSGPLVLASIVWLPIALAGLKRRQAARLAEPAPTLLVLRVFKQADMVAAVFDDVVERWRASGNTVLIAGTDLVDQTLDATDLLDYLDGRLAERFVHSAAALPERLAAFDWQPDAEGRWRVNEIYCHDTTWQLALAALVERSDRVLMDLRGFAAHNAGCRFEIGELARAAHLERAVLLVDASTDLATARAAAADAPAGRFVWIELPADAIAARRATRRQVMAALLDAPAPAPLPPAPIEATAF